MYVTQNVFQVPNEKETDAMDMTNTSRNKIEELQIEEYVWNLHIIVDMTINF